MALETTTEKLARDWIEARSYRKTRTVRADNGTKRRDLTPSQASEMVKSGAGAFSEPDDGQIQLLQDDDGVYFEAPDLGAPRPVVDYLLDGTAQALADYLTNAGVSEEVVLIARADGQVPGVDEHVRAVAPDQLSNEVAHGWTEVQRINAN